ncbi:Hop2 protein [Saccharomycopsis crataegensis]|uniref:Hop2 protein n=1 Tax=Saccharomycopsis crataegensis TaxID=43959 RepID=A0AAV5QKF2_9ASCO|nr:Hop2 protein [Saccharomycopsis crataegensis]
MPPKKKVKKDDQIKDLETASGILLGYLKEQFRPYSINDIILNLHNKISKSVALKALALLATNNKLLMKTYGKMNFYVYRYGKDDQQQAIDESGKEITIQVVTDLENSFEEVKNRLKELNSALKQATIEPNNENLLVERRSLVKDITTDRELCKSLEESIKGKIINNEEIIKLTDDINNLERICKSRKKDYSNILGLLKENFPEYKSILEKAGVEE